MTGDSTGLCCVVVYQRKSARFSSAAFPISTGSPASCDLVNGPCVPEVVAVIGEQMSLIYRLEHSFLTQSGSQSPSQNDCFHRGILYT